jgi:hypothetical protein
MILSRIQNNFKHINALERLCKMLVMGNAPTFQRGNYTWDQICFREHNKLLRYRTLRIYTWRNSWCLLPGLQPQIPAPAINPTRPNVNTIVDQLTAALLKAPLEVILHATIPGGPSATTESVYPVKQDCSNFPCISSVALQYAQQLSWSPILGYGVTAELFE